jgi:hypothetical protein
VLSVRWCDEVEGVVVRYYDIEDASGKDLSEEEINRAISCGKDLSEEEMSMAISCVKAILKASALKRLHKK